MICSQGGRGGISRGVFCPKIPGNENRVNVSYQIFTFNSRIFGWKNNKNKKGSKCKVFSNTLCSGVIKGKGSKSK